MTDNPNSEYLVRYSQEDLRSMLLLMFEEEAIIPPSDAPLNELVVMHEQKANAYIHQCSYLRDKNCYLTILNSRFDIKRALTRVISILRAQGGE